MLKWLAFVLAFWGVGGAFIGAVAITSSPSVSREATVVFMREPDYPTSSVTEAEPDPKVDPVGKRLERRLERLRARVLRQHKQIAGLGDLVRAERARVRKAASRTIRVERLISFARGAIGTPYVWGGESYREGGFDCSGLVIAAYRAAGIEFGHRMTTWSVRTLGRAISLAQIAPGDVVVTGSGGHMVLYEGAGRVISAPFTGATVKRDRLANYRVVDVRRLF